MKGFVKAIYKDGKGFRYFKQKFPRIVEKEHIFWSSNQTFHHEFDTTVNYSEGSAVYLQNPDAELFRQSSVTQTF
jgi:hypothetical protein